jgi:hypothetical protein
MAATQNKHSVSGAQGSRRRAHAPTKPVTRIQKAKHRSATRAQTTAKPRSATRSRAKPRKSRLPKPIVTRRGKTTIRRYPGRTFYCFEEAKGKPIDSVQVFTGGGNHAIDVCFEDKTAIHFVIEPGFTLEADYADWKTGNWQPIKHWPLIRSQGLSA